MNVAGTPMEARETNTYMEIHVVAILFDLDGYESHLFATGSFHMDIQLHTASTTI